ncbi:DUF2291 family protein [Aureimonas ureilytica]|uniref:DUF2291 family protein n=1 Tax=Aureimonas ureilytica TaxID=401562 RepID=UPI003CF5957D
MSHTPKLPLVALGLALALTGCKFIETAELAARKEAAAKPKAGAGATAMWATQVTPYFSQKAHPFAEVRPAIAADLDAAGRNFGYREVQEGAPWNFAVHVKGTVVAANTQSRAATAELDTDGDGKGDVTLQLGPVIKGTSIRDVLPFVSFTQYSNQIEYADVAKAFNTQAYETALKDLPRDKLVGASVEATGVFTMKTKGDKILLTPVLVSLGGGA